MKKLFKVALLLTAVMYLAGAQANGQEVQISKSEQEVRNLERQWLDAYEQHDAAAMDKIVGNDWMITYPNGGTQTKEQVMKLVASPRKPGMAGPKFSSENVQSRVYGDSVVVLTGRIVTQWPGAESKEQSRYTDTYVKRGGAWQVVASHMSNEGPPRTKKQPPPQPAQTQPE